MSELERSYNAAKMEGKAVRALCIINPGNPTGNVFSRQTLEEIVIFCKNHQMVLLADEVYQDNIYGPRSFISARKVAIE